MTGRADSRAMSADRHNHITRDIKPLGAGCLACDRHWDAQRGSAVVYTSETDSLSPERADCPDHGVGHDDCHQDCLACCGHQCDEDCFPDDDGVDVSAEAAMASLETVIGSSDCDHDSMCPLFGKTVVRSVGQWPEQRRVPVSYVVGAYGCRCALISEVTARCVDRAQQAVNTFIKAFDHPVSCECVGCDDADLVVMAVAGHPIDGYFPAPYTRQDAR